MSGSTLALEDLLNRDDLPEDVREAIREEIVEHKRREVAARRERRPLRVLIGGLRGRSERDFERALRKPGLSVIAEFKRRSPSKGHLRENADVGSIATTYAKPKRRKSRPRSVLRNRPKLNFAQALAVKRF